MKTKDSNKTKKTLLLCYIPHLYSFSPQRFKKLARDLNDDSVVISFDPRSQRLLEDIGIPFKRARAYLEKDIDKAINRVYEHLGFKWNSLKENCEFYYGYDDPIYLAATEKIFYEEMFEIIYALFLLEYIINIEMPREIWVIAEPGLIKRTALELVKTRALKCNVIRLRMSFILTFLLKRMCNVGAQVLRKLQV